MSARASNEEGPRYSPELTAIYFPAIVKFTVGLEKASMDFERWPRESAAVAIAATMAFVKNMKWEMHYLPPLQLALEMLEKGIDPESLPYCRRMQAVVGDIDEFIEKPAPPVDAFKDLKSLPFRDIIRIAACVAVDYQLACKVPLRKALRKVVGPDNAEHIENFRENLRRKKKGVHREVYDMATNTLRRLPAERAAQLALTAYRTQVGKKQKP
jgi:hypothetical protein